MKSFALPLRATHHCRHYSYNMGLGPNSGPQCAAGISNIAMALNTCCQNAPVPCPLREEFTDAERAAWQQARAEGLERLGAAIAALPRAIPLNTGGTIECPNCAGALSYARWHRGAELRCATANCCAAHFSIQAGADWPAPEAEGAAA